MTEPEPAANPQALTEEMVEAAAKILWENVNSAEWKRAHPPYRREYINLATRVLSAALSLSRPAADRGQIVEECARRFDAFARQYSLALPSPVFAAMMKAIASVRALSPAPAQTEE